MSRFSMVFLAAAVACGGSKKPVDNPILPPDQTAAAKPDEAAKPDPEPVKAPEKAPEPMKPADVSLPLGDTTVKLVDAGKGKKAKLAFAPKADAKQHVEIAMDFRAKQDSEDDISPTMILGGDATVKGGTNGSYAVQLAVTTADAKDVAGVEAARREAPAGAGLARRHDDRRRGRAVDGTTKELALHIDKPDQMTGSALQLLGLAWPEWVALSAEAIGGGAKWVGTPKTHHAEKLEVTRVTSYELTAHTGNAWTVKETVKVTGADQDVDGTKATNIAGSGSGQLTIADGAIYPSGTTQGETHFTVAAQDKKIVLSITTGATIKTQ